MSAPLGDVFWDTQWDTAHPCPVCHHHPKTRVVAERCEGGWSAARPEIAYCTWSERNDAGLPHRLGGGCGCAVFHPVPPSRNGHGPSGGDGGGAPLFTDTRNAARFVATHGAHARHDYTRGLWRLWDGMRWRLDEMQRVMVLAKGVVRTMHTELELLDPQVAARLRNQVLAVESTGRLKAMIENASSDLAADHETFDPDPYLLNTLSGVVDLRTGEVRPHDPELWQSKLAPVAYDPAATCPTWDAFLDRIFDGDAELIGFIQRAAGLTLVGEVVEHVLFVMWGGGANGKSTFLTAMLEMLGDYARAAAPELLLHHDSPQHSTNIAELRGVRFVSAVETDATSRLSEPLVKMLTGGDTRNARFMRMDAFTYKPSDTFWVGTNHKPNIRSSSEGIWRRVHLIPFNVTIPPAEQDGHLADRLRSEYPGILAWAVRGCIEWQQPGGLGFAAAVDRATATYRGEQDALAEFIDDCCIQGPLMVTLASEMYAKYQQWCIENGERASTQRLLGIKLGERGFQRRRFGKQNKWAWSGVGLVTDSLFDGRVSPDSRTDDGPGEPIDEPDYLV